MSGAADGPLIRTVQPGLSTGQLLERTTEGRVESNWWGSPGEAHGIVVIPLCSDIRIKGEEEQYERCEVDEPDEQREPSLPVT